MKTLKLWMGWMGQGSGLDGACCLCRHRDLDTSIATVRLSKPRSATRPHSHPACNICCSCSLSRLNHPGTPTK